MILPSLLVLTTATLTCTEPADFPSPLTKQIEPIFHAMVDPALYFGSGMLFGSATLLSGVGWVLSQGFPWVGAVGNEWLISSQIFSTASIHCFARSFQVMPLFSFLCKNVPSSRLAWDANQKLLSEVPVQTREDQALVNFLQKRWLAKVTGIYPFLVDWMCPAFGISFQLHPESTNSYARDPSTKQSDTYRYRVEEWKEHLPHPHDFPLILTRPDNIGPHLPSYVEMLPVETLKQRLTHTPHEKGAPIVIDVTSVFEDIGNWPAAEKHLRGCTADLNDVVCIQRVQQKEMGGIRILPLSLKENTDKHYDFLLEWISRFGLTANRIELDRPLFSEKIEQAGIPISIEFHCIQEWISFIDSVEQSWKLTHPQKTLLFQGTLQILKAIVSSQEKWEETMLNPTRGSLVQLAFKKIKQQLLQLLNMAEKATFHEVATQIEQIHADFTSLLEIFMPFAAKNFSEIYQRHLTHIPQKLLPLTGYALHASAMTSFGAIFQAIDKAIGRPAHILYGENTYFEIINLAERVSKASPIKEARDPDWEEADLILVQFNPTVKRINFEVTEYQATEYHVEKITEIVRHALMMRHGKPLTIAIDCTLDYSNSPRVGTLLCEFENAIVNGQLNVICYRSGIKFDLFGMDNYCGAPFTLTNNGEQQWACFDALLTDPVLQTDRLSLNWFCLVYEHAASFLEGYRKQIFDNTRAVLNKIPTSLYNKENPFYRVIPTDADVDPTFVDIKIFGPLHAFRGDLLVGAYLTVKCMEAGFPLLYRPGIGFYHPNLAVLFGKECTTVRLTVGLDPAQVDVIVRCLETIDACNGQFNLSSLPKLLSMHCRP